ncbi:IS1096 element passenger TnpR family protein [Arenibaculum sp.]|jgi:hypothetical protein|uniref:IS1096 element passenger TnpR family protein n=1 Tax=Arenibaculum sp. TaxID=2865862 RepID=UPI002E0E7C01|nr:hypothetical protein [Arenibaculum sp.]
MATAGTHIFRVALWDDPSVHRDIEIDDGKSLYDLAKGIVRAFDFDFDHAFGFYSGLTDETLREARPKYELFADMGEAGDAESVRKTRVAAAFPAIGHTLVFLFDYGDEWLFRVEMIGSGAKIPGARYPKVLAKAGSAPEQYPEWEEDEE